MTRVLFDFTPYASEQNAIRWQQSYWVGDDRISDSFGRPLGARSLDLLDIAMAAYVADRTTPRSASGIARGGRGWIRDLSLRVAVSDPDYWTQDDVHSKIAGLLRWLTDDEWSFDFVPRSEHSPWRSTQGSLFQSSPTRRRRAALFSGGLDSLAGLASVLLASQDDELVLISATSTTAIRRVQLDLFHRLRSGRPESLSMVGVPLHLNRAVVGRFDERSQRTRGFVHLIIGAIVAMAAGSEELLIFENGIGAINLPYADGQVGAQSSRPVHPATLRKMTDLVRITLGWRLEIKLPFLWSTKGEMCAQLDPAAQALIPRSVSCDGFPSRIASRPNCGTCTSCLLRRQALWAAGLGEIDMKDRYREDVLKLEKGYPAELHAMLDQAADLADCLNAVDPWRALVKRFPMISDVPDTSGGPLLTEIEKKAICGLFDRYVAEWCSLPSGLIASYLGDGQLHRKAS